MVVWDMPDHGQSFRSEQKFNFQFAAECFIDLLDEINAEGVVLVGASLGGYVSQYIAYKYPERIQGIVVVGATSLYSELTRLQTLVSKMHDKSLRVLPWKLISYLLRKMLGPRHNSKPYMEECLSKLNKTRILRLSEGTKEGIYKGIKEPVKAPLLIVHGGNELSFIRKMSAYWHHNTPQSEYAVISDSGHAVTLDKPEEFNEILYRFLEKYISS